MMPQAEERGAVPNIGPQFASEWREELFSTAAQRTLLDQGIGEQRLLTKELKSQDHLLADQSLSVICVVLRATSRSGLMLQW